MMYAVIQVREGHAEALKSGKTEPVQVTRVPCVGEWLVMWGRPRKVIAVEHWSVPWTPLSPGGVVVMQTVSPSALVTVADE